MKDTHNQGRNLCTRRKPFLKNIDKNLEKDGLKTREKMTGFCKWKTVYKAVKTA